MILFSPSYSERAPLSLDTCGMFVEIHAPALFVGVAGVPPWAQTEKFWELNLEGQLVSEPLPRDQGEVIACLSSVTLVHPTQAVEIFRNVHIPFGTLAIC